MAAFVTIRSSTSALPCDLLRRTPLSLSSPRKRRRLIQSLAHPESVFDTGIDLSRHTGDALQDLAESIIAERRRANFRSYLPDRVEVRFLPPHMMRFPTASTQQTHWIQQREGLPEKPTQFDELLAKLFSPLRRRRRQKADPFSGVQTAQDGNGPRVAWLSQRASISYATSYPYEQEGQVEPSAGSMILLSRQLGAEEELRQAIERELCVVSEYSIVGRQRGGFVFDLLARRSMLRDPSIFIGRLSAPLVIETATTKCLNVRCGHLQAAEDAPSTCPTCSQPLTHLPHGDADLPAAVFSRYGSPSARLYVATGMTILPVVRFAFWLVKPIWDSPTLYAFPLQFVFLLAAVLAGTLVLYKLAMRRDEGSFGGNLEALRPYGFKRNRGHARVDASEEIRQARLRDKAYKAEEKAKQEGN